MPDTRFPTDLRPFTVTRRHAFMASLPALCRIFLFILIALIALEVYISANAYGFDAIIEHLGYWLKGLVFALWPAYAFFAIACALMYHMAGRQKVIGIPVRYGSDDAGIYIDDFYGFSFCRWKLFISWSETREFILLNDGVRKILWPKAVWSEEELEAQRGLMREKISPRRVH